MNENVKAGIHPNAQTVIDATFSKREKEIAISPMGTAIILRRDALIFFQ